jgi:hypothetical protein
MRSKSTKSLIKTALKNLTWAYVDRPHDMPLIRIASYPAKQSHVIYMPDELHMRSSDLDYLHELGHATFCERVHPVFAANILYAPLQNKQEFVKILPALNTACDWFIGHWQIELSPDSALKMLKKTLKTAEKILAEPTLPPLEIILYAALLIAQAVKYLDEPVDCGGVLKVAVDAFLSTPPDEPSLANCVLLINKLLATYTEQRVRFVEAGETSSWELYTEENKKTAASTKTGRKRAAK